MTSGIPTGILVLALFSLVLSAAISWARRDRYTGPTLPRLATMATDFALTNLMIVMIAAAIIQVSVRFLFSRYVIIVWTEELAILALIWLSFLAGALLIAEGGHIVFEAIWLMLPAGMRRANLVLVEILTIVILVPIAWYGYQNARSLDIVMTVSLGLPLAAFGFVVPVAALLMVVLTVVQLVRHLRRALPGSGEREGSR